MQFPKIINLADYKSKKGEAKMSEQENKPESFGAREVGVLYKDLTTHNWALRAFGALLESADMGRYFDNDCVDAQDYRWGLKRIVELYIDHQEKRLDDILARAKNAPDTIIDRALNVYSDVKKGVYRNNDSALEAIKAATGELEKVILNFGDEYPRAEKAKNKLSSLHGAVIQRIREEATQAISDSLKKEKKFQE